MNMDSKHWLFLRKGKPGSQLQVEKYYHLQTTSKPRGRRHWLVPQPGSAPLPSTGCPGAMQFSSPCCWEPTPVWHQPSWEEWVPHHWHNMRLCSGMAIPPRRKCSLPFPSLASQKVRHVRETWKSASPFCWRTHARQLPTPQFIPPAPGQVKLAVHPERLLQVCKNWEFVNSSARSILLSSPRFPLSMTASLVVLIRDPTSFYHKEHDNYTLSIALWFTAIDALS